jgi:hypothetical protein
MFFLYFVKVFFFFFVCPLDREEVQCGHSNKKKRIREKLKQTYMGRFLRENDALALAYRRIGMGVALALALAYYILAVAIRALPI